MQLAHRWSCFINLLWRKNKTLFLKSLADNLVSSAKSVDAYFLVPARVTVTLG